MKIVTQLRLPAPIELPTTDGRALRLEPLGNAFPAYTFELAVHPAPTAGAYARDVLEHRMWIADAEGTVWSAVSRCTSEWLVEQLAMSTFENARLLSPWDAEPGLHAAFESPLLRDVAYASDDRLYRSLLLRGRWMQCIFKYTTLLFDVAARTDGDGWLRLYARLQGDCWECFDSPEAEERERLPALVFELDHPSVLITRNTAVAGPADGEWSDSPLALPVVFARAGDGATPQAGVRVVG